MYVSENTQEAPLPSVGCAIKTKLGPDMYSRYVRFSVHRSARPNKRPFRCESDNRVGR